MAEHSELALGYAERLLLERIDRSVDDEEADEVAGRPDRQRPEVVALVGPVRERAVPGQVQQRRGVLAEPQLRKGRTDRGVGQMRFRRYVVTVAS
jgi:hypothetical protein